MTGQGPRRDVPHGVGDGLDMLGRGAAATPREVEKTALGETAEILVHDGGGFVELTEGVGQAGVEVGAEIAVRYPGQILDKGPDLAEAAAAVGAHDQGAGVGHSVPERLGVLAGQHPPADIREGDRDHQRVLAPQLIEHLLYREDGGLGVEGVEDGLDHQQVDTALQQSPGRDGVVRAQLVEGDAAGAGIVYIRGDGRRLRGGAQHTGNEARLLRGLGGHAISRLAGELRRRQVQLPGQRAQLVVILGNGGAVEGVGFNDIRPRFQVAPVNAADDIGPGQGQQVVVALEIAGVSRKALAAVIRFLQARLLDHGSHGPVQDQDAVLQGLFQRGGFEGFDCHGVACLCTVVGATRQVPPLKKRASLADRAAHFRLSWLALAFLCTRLL